jgi:virginiamycin B lyase
MGIREQLHEAFDGQDFSNDALLARVVTQLDSSRRADSHQWAAAIAVILTITLVATLLVARAARDASHGAPTPSGQISKCLLTHTTTPSSGGHGSITEYPVPADLDPLVDITRGPDGSLWLGGYATNAPNAMIVKLTTSGVFTEYRVPTANTFIGGITTGPDGNIWFTETHLDPGGPASGPRHGNVAKVAKLTTSGTFTEYSVPGSAAELGGIITGADCNLWVIDSGANEVLKVSTSGSLTEYATPSALSHPEAITAGPDGAVWFTESSAAKVARVTTSGHITEFPLPTTGDSFQYWPSGLTAGPDGNLWLTEKGNWLGGGPGRVARLSTSGVFSAYDIPTTKVAPGLHLLREAGPSTIAAGPDGNLWFSVSWNLDSVTTAGVFSQYIVPAPDGHFGSVYQMTAGPDGAVWFTGRDITNDRPLVGKVVFKAASSSS